MLPASHPLPAVAPSTRPRAVFSPTVLISLALLILTLLLYWPVRQHEFVRWDDTIYLTGNPHLQQGFTWAAVRWAFTEFYAANWHPLTWLSHLVDCQLWGLRAGPHHLTSAALHALNSVLLFLVLVRMTGARGRSAVVAALFAWHPLHVESVAWAAERKDVLSTGFWMLTLMAYLAYVRRGGWARYLLVASCFTLGLLAKPMLVTLPFTLLLLDFWPLGRLPSEFSWVSLRPLLLEKVPLLVLAAAASVVTFLAQQSGGAVQSLERLSLGSRLGNCSLSYVAYLGQLFWPARLSIPYPYRHDLSAFSISAALALLAVITTSVVLWRRRQPYLLFGWLWYLGTLVPVIGLVQVGEQAMADRYTYIPSIGIFIMLAWGWHALLGRSRGGQVALALGTAASLAACSYLSAWQISVWRDSVTLFEHSLALRPTPEIQSNYGLLLLERGRVDEAIAHCESALALNAASFTAHKTLGVALYLQGRIEEAIGHSRQALALFPGDVGAQSNLARIYLERGRVAEAVPVLAALLAREPENIDALRKLAWVRATAADPSLRNGSAAEKMAARAAALTHAEDAGALDVQAAALAESGRFREALPVARQAQRLALAAGRPALATEIRSRIELYELGLPYRSPR